MKSILFLIIIIGIYYYINKKNKIEITKKNHMYFWAFVIIYSLIVYCMSHQKEFVYKLVSNMNNSTNKNYYDLLPSDHEEQTQNDIKRIVYIKRGGRCSQCKSVLMSKDLSKYHLHYIVSPQHGGINHIDNLALRCQVCNSFPHSF